MDKEFNFFAKSAKLRQIWSLIQWSKCRTCLICLHF